MFLLRTLRDDTEFRPGKPGRGVAVPLHRGRASINKERRRAGTPTTLEENFRKKLNGEDDTEKPTRRQAHAHRWLKQRYGLSGNYAAVVAAELGLGGV